MTRGERGWLLDAKAKPDASIALVFIDSDTGRRIERIIRHYEPYCLVPADLGLEHVRKTNLFTGLAVTLGKLPASSKPKNVQVWEDQIRPEMSCVYDLGLNFGAEHNLEGEVPRPSMGYDDSTKSEFENEFGSLRRKDPTKHSFVDRFFSLLEQPIPKLDPAAMGLSDEATEEQYESAFVLSRIANLPPSQVQRRQSVSDWIRSALYTYYRANNVLIPTGDELRRGVQKWTVEGALTLPPAAGLYHGMTVLDFESLYPSCIDTFNLSYETVDCEHSKCRTNRVPEIEHYVCVERRGIFSAFTGALRDLRVRWYKPRTRGVELAQDQRIGASLVARLLKLLSVSCYGVTVRIQGLASPILAESITAYGRHALRRTWQIAQQLRLSPKYGDTDSIFLDNPSEESVASLIRGVHDDLGLELAVDKRYDVCVLTTAKKAYLGIQPDGVGDIKGLTAAKSSSPQFFREVVSRLVKAISGLSKPDELDRMKREIIRVVEDSVADLRSGRVRVRDLEYKVSLWKEPKEKFDSHILPQAYQAAKLLQRRGRTPRRRHEITFVKVRPFKVGSRSFTVKPPDETRLDEINTEDYVRSLLQSLSQVTDPMGIDLMSLSTKTLTEYM